MSKPRHPLVRKGRIGEPIAQHDIATGERRLYHLQHVITPRREDKQRFSQRVHRLLQDQTAQRFGERRAARLSRARHVATLHSEKNGQRIDVAGFAGAVDALQRQKQSAH